MSNLPLQIEAQATKALQEFTLFPALPIELRRKIWKASFPGPRPVNFSWYNIEPTPESSKLSQYEEASRLPEALSVNRESRKEALRDFVIIHRADFTMCWDHQEKHKPKCVNVKRDFAYLTFADMRYWGSGWINDIKQAQPSSGPKIIDDIEVLHVRNFLSDELIEFWKFMDVSIHLGPILEFSGLKKVIFTGCDLVMMSKEAETSAKEVIQGFLDGHKEMFATKEVPEIIVQGWKALLTPENEQEILDALS